MTQSSKSGTERLLGYDLARSLAILGMMLVHFSLVMSMTQIHSGWLGKVIDLLDGRAAATFLVVAGAGLTLISRRAVASGDPVKTGSVRRLVLRRGVFLLLCGFLNLLIWPGDILRVYGLSFILASAFLGASGRWLWQWSVFFAVGFVVLLLLFDYEQNWDWTTLTYHNLWTPLGALRNLFYDGFRAVFPWAGLLFFGMWLGRHDLKQPVTRRKFLCWGIGLVTVSHLCSATLLGYFQNYPNGLNAEEITAVFGTESMPPMPLFLLSGLGAAITVIALSFGIVEQWGSAKLVQSLVATGQMAFTWYVAHLVIGLGTVFALGWTGTVPLWIAFTTGTGFFLLAMWLSSAWKRHFRNGPLETLLRWWSDAARLSPTRTPLILCLLIVIFLVIVISTPPNSLLSEPTNSVLSLTHDSQRPGPRQLMEPEVSG